MIRTATPADAAALAELAAATFPLACPPGNKPEDIQDFIDTHLTEAHFAEYLADPARVILVADDFAGYTMLVITEPTDEDVVAAITHHPTAELSKCYVRAGNHGSGLASELMLATIAAARAAGAAGIWLGVNDQNAKANRFYAKHGFAKVGTKRFKLGDHWEDDFVRELAL
jgi:ribosomal protein S18 acetylase RimI-like enzyme